MGEFEFSGKAYMIRCRMYCQQNKETAQSTRNDLIEERYYIVRITALE